MSSRQLVQAPVWSWTTSHSLPLLNHWRSILDKTSSTLGQCSSPLPTKRWPKVVCTLTPTLTLLSCVAVTSRYAHNVEWSSLDREFFQFYPSNSPFMSQFAYCSPSSESAFGLQLPSESIPHLCFFLGFFWLLRPPLAAVKVEASHTMNEPRSEKGDTWNPRAHTVPSERIMTEAFNHLDLLKSACL